MAWPDNNPEGINQYSRSFGSGKNMTSSVKTPRAYVYSRAIEQLKSQMSMKKFR